MADDDYSLTVHNAFVHAWQDAQNPPLDRENPHFHSRFASLEATLKAVREVCGKWGLAYVQRMSKSEDGYEMRSSVMDCTGACIELSRYPVAVPADPQKFGAILTYTKRQQAQADWGIAGEEDDDAESAGGSGGLSGRCAGCGAVYTFGDGSQMDGFACPQCGGRFERC